jgi:surface protein
MLYNASAFNQPLNTWDTSRVTTMKSMFVNASSFNQPLDNWDTGNVTTMMGMFYLAVSFNQDISGWYVSKVTDHTVFLTGAGSGSIEPNGLNSLSS